MPPTSFLFLVLLQLHIVLIDFAGLVVFTTLAGLALRLLVPIAVPVHVFVDLFAVPVRMVDLVVVYRFTKHALEFVLQPISLLMLPPSIMVVAKRMTTLDDLVHRRSLTHPAPHIRRCRHLLARDILPRRPVAGLGGDLDVPLVTTTTVRLVVVSVLSSSSVYIAEWSHVHTA